MAKARPLEWLGYQNPQPVAADLRSLSTQELEELAGATATAIIKAAHLREQEAEKRATELMNTAITESDRLRRDAEKFATQTTSSAQKNATSLIESANETAQKSLKNAERQAAKMLDEANKQSEELISRAQVEAVRIRHEMEQSMKAAKEQMNAALVKFNAGIQAELQTMRQVAMKAEHLESELITARDSVTNLTASLFTPETKATSKKNG